MAVDGALEERLRRGGMAPMTPELAVKALQQALDLRETHLAIADLDWERFVPSYVAVRAAGCWTRCPRRAGSWKPRSAVAPRRSSRPVAPNCASGSPECRRRSRNERLLDLVTTQVAMVLGFPSVESVESQPGLP
ncbi:Polyketide synthase OS=Streptomyces antimycoticus OX=68175 GN=SANT12839_089600 PE=4 SV=1 [Streptomyces antimycoticus]